MKIILKTEVAGLGEEGDVLTVSDGYARNHLFPAKNAVMHNAQNISVLKSQQASIDKRKTERRQSYLSLKEQLEAMQLVVKMKTGETGHLFGAVTSTVIQEELKKLGIEIFKKQIHIPHHSIKDIGEYEIDIKLLGKINAVLKVRIEDIDGKVQIKTADATESTDAEVEASDLNDTIDANVKSVATEEQAHESAVAPSSEELPADTALADTSLIGTSSADNSTSETTSE